MTIRLAGQEDLDGAAAVLRAAYAQYAPAPDAPPAARAAFAHYLRDVEDVRSRPAPAELLVLEEDGRALAAVTFYPPGATAEYPSQAVVPFPVEWAAFRLLGVHPDARGRGLGRVLTEECLRRARAAAAPVLALHTSVLMDVARALYVRMGWQRVPRHDFSPMPGLTVEAYQLAL